MIIVRSPLRISLGGGGTDLSSYYRDHGGFVIAAAIDRYVYITLHETFVDYLIVKYSEMEKVGTVEELKHPLVREALILTKTAGAGLESLLCQTSLREVVSVLLVASQLPFFLLSMYLNMSPSQSAHWPKWPATLRLTCWASRSASRTSSSPLMGASPAFDFERDDSVGVSPLRIDPITLHNLEDNLMLFFTKYTRNASEILKDQDARSRQGDQSMIENLHVVKRLGYESKAALEAGDLRGYAEIMHTHWEHKRSERRE